MPDMQQKRNGKAEIAGEGDRFFSLEESRTRKHRLLDTGPAFSRAGCLLGSHPSQLAPSQPKKKWRASFLSFAEPKRQMVVANAETKRTQKLRLGYFASSTEDRSHLLSILRSCLEMAAPFALGEYCQQGWASSTSIVKSSTSMRHSSTVIRLDSKFWPKSSIPAGKQKKTGNKSGKGRKRPRIQRH